MNKSITKITSEQFDNLKKPLFDEKYHQEQMELMKDVKLHNLKGKALKRYVKKQMKKIRRRSYKIFLTSAWAEVKHPWQKKFIRTFVSKD